MTKQYFNFEEVFSFSWTKAKQHAWFLACMFIIYAIIMSAVRLVPVLEQLVMVLVVLSLLSMSLIMVKGESFSFESLFNRLRSPHLVIKFLVLTVIYVAAVSAFVIPFMAAITVTLGTVFFNGLTSISWKLIMALLATFAMLLPGMYVAIRFKFYPYVLLEHENMKILDIIKHSYNLTCCVFWRLLGFFILVALLNTLGVLAFGFGLVLTLPVSILAIAHLYRKLEVHAH
ncbi:hypothetical protein K9M47_02060 [Candidatus Gracilibacteria bacterium]|nr:hypothetical protein [Candidatus Gracilibacteria bacterium]MCF7898677.1 hypothetical protein [Candidatus Paceibacterota bacterium]